MAVRQSQYYNFLFIFIKWLIFEAFARLLDDHTLCFCRSLEFNIIDSSFLVSLVYKKLYSLLSLRGERKTSSIIINFTIKCVRRLKYVKMVRLRLHNYNLQFWRINDPVIYLMMSNFSNLLLLFNSVFFFF